ncbi:MAG: hypothetical protein R6V18_07825, partial [Desulfuromonadaceae bacterium]
IKRLGAFLVDGYGVLLIRWHNGKRLKMRFFRLMPFGNGDHCAFIAFIDLPIIFICSVSHHLFCRVC